MSREIQRNPRVRDLQAEKGFARPTRLFVLALGAYWSLVGCGGTLELSAPTRGKSSEHRIETKVQESPIVVPTTGEGILQAVRDLDANVVLLNVWATWCRPCREEFPDILRLQREYQDEGLKVILVSGDFDTEIREVIAFLAGQGVDFPSYIKAGSDMDFINAINPEWSGALPATFIYDADGTMRHFWEGKVSYVKFEQSILEVLRKGVKWDSETTE